VLEALAIADRIIVMSGGRVTLNVLARDASEQMLIAAANASSQATVAKV
jgi:ABC-type sugar transport system ATPase subunit